MEVSYGRLKVLTRKTAICALLTTFAGQYIIGEAEHPPVIASPASCSIQAAAQWLVGTSANTPVGAGGA